jgi:hypothetical protein
MSSSRIPFTSHVAPHTVVSHTSAGGPSNTGFHALMQFLTPMERLSLSETNREMYETLQAHDRLNPLLRRGPYLRKVKFSVFIYDSIKGFGERGYNQILYKNFSMLWPVPSKTFTNPKEELETIQHELLQTNDFLKNLDTKFHERDSDGIKHRRKITQKQREFFYDVLREKGFYEKSSMLTGGPALIIERGVKLHEKIDGDLVYDYYIFQIRMYL